MSKFDKNKKQHGELNELIIAIVVVIDYAPNCLVEYAEKI